jgi:polysaccharide deacetylase 2 family uncharacterized protein YibQ
MAKRKRRVTGHSSNILAYIAWLLGAIALLLSALVTGYYYGYENAKEEIAKKSKYEKQIKDKISKRLDDSTKKNEAIISDSVNDRLKEVLKKEANITEIKSEVPTIAKTHEEIPARKVKEETLKAKSPVYGGAAHEYGDESTDIPPPAAENNLKIVTSKRAKLAIIIDDVSARSQVNALNSLGITLTMSFLPPSKDRPSSAKLAAQESQYMVHLPMEANSFSAEEPFTLRVNDSQEDISKRIRDLKVLFPKVKYINNHTGSKFTSNEGAMNKLVFALNENHINFIDSRTTAKTEAPRVMKNYGLRYMSRDVFLDHHMDKSYIIEQIKQAILIAKKHGTAIAIGHPHANTILALHECSNLFKDIDLVTIDKLN